MVIAAKLIPARYYARLGVLLSDMGIDTGSLLQRAGLKPEDIEDADAYLSMPQVESLVTAALEQSGRSDIGLELARVLTPTSHDMVSNGILSSPTLDLALRFVSRFFSLILPSFRMNYWVEPEHMWISVVPVMPQSPTCLAFHLELIAAAIYWASGDLLRRPVPPPNIYCSFKKPLHAARYAQFKGAKVHFGWHSRPGVSLSWPSSLATESLGFPDPQALELARQRCHEMVVRSRLRDNLADWVFMMLRESKDGMPSMQELADTLSMSPRTLDRQLKKLDTSFRQLSGRAVNEKACDLLAKGELSVTQVALELGYSDASNFSRAFRRSFDVSPKQWQQQN